MWEPCHKADYLLTSTYLSILSEIRSSQVAQKFKSERVQVLTRY